MTETNPRCWNCVWSEPAINHKDADERPAVGDFVYCGKSKTFMYRFDYCTQHPEIAKAVMAAKERANGRT